MRIVLSWLREFVDVPATPDEIASTLSVRGFAVEGLEALEGGDAVIDFEVTANRPDCLSVMGMAREVATAYGLQVRRPAVGASTLTLAPLKVVDSGELDVVIEAPALCPRYAAALAEVTIGPSPDWMQARLRAAGIRPINNIVDATNYVMLELGQPMHAFDADRIGGAQIRVRHARTGETLRTLDGELRELSPEMLMIADDSQPIAVAGVMGGANSEVSDRTRTIVLESAYFDPRSVRRTSRQLALKTEASIRFERGADPRLPVTAIERACALIEAIGAGRARGTVIDRYPVRIEPRVVRLRRQRIRDLLGVEIPDTDVRRILDGLGFALRDAADGWEVTVPTRRVDVLREVDLIEEVARHYGFDRIPVTFPPLSAAPPPIDPRITRARRLRAVMTGAGFSEAMTFGFVAQAAAAPFVDAGDLVPIANPLSENFAVLRPSVLPGLVDAVAHNRRREQRDVRLFEVGARFRLSDGERQALGCVWTGMVGGDHWSGGTREVDFFDIKGLVERVADALRVDLRFEPGGPAWLVPGRAARATAAGTLIGVAGQLSPAIAGRHGLPPRDAVYVAELDLDAAQAASAGDQITIAPLPLYPSVTRDVSILVDETLAAERLRSTIRRVAPPTLVRVREFDRYRGPGIPEGKVSVSLRLTFRSPDRTLTDAEVQRAMDDIAGALVREHGAVQR